eukprot:CAMPEP_0118889330 /NCGR_PEP_ID=MMETSP1166-20130328/311_1 /TAXON_ID=1104430 /ORGANISM="Chrysoreinhardia sp, Strain CCMP3193" /LENGTH=101 /DNA_ID=CAMNT_0006827917 /DNA_START=197 /DNA_END=498 /DNA_ORIENTATION=-
MSFAFEPDEASNLSGSANALMDVQHSAGDSGDNNEEPGCEAASARTGDCPTSVSRVGRNASAEEGGRVGGVDWEESIGSLVIDEAAEVSNPRQSGRTVQAP